MKTFSILTASVCQVAMLHFMAVSCDRLGEKEQCGTGRLCISFEQYEGALTRAGTDVPDTSDFKLRVSDSQGNVVYEGDYGDCPESFEVNPGTYVIRAVSREFSKPEFNAAQFGDEQCVVVTSGERAGVKLVCAQMNAAVALDVSSDFLSACPDAVIFLKSSSGKLMYSYSEKRWAYFPPENVSLMMSSGGVDRILMTRKLESREMLKIKVRVPVGQTTGREVSISVDTARVWKNEDYVIGSGEESHAVLTVAQAMSAIGDKERWVSGYIVGGDLTSASASFAPPFKSRTNLVLGPRSSTVDRAACISVQLSEGIVRDALNLVDNPDMEGRKVKLKGDLVAAYYGMPGLKNVVEYELL